MTDLKNIQLEKVSAIIHGMWTSWAKKLLETEENISEARIKRWREDCFKPYEELSEEMKMLDRHFAIEIFKKIKDERKRNKKNKQVSKFDSKT